MINFKSVELYDRDWYRGISKSDIGCSVCFNFENIYLWNDTFPKKLAQVGNRATTIFNVNNATVFSYPIGTGDIKSAILELKDYADSHDFPLILYGTEENHCKLINETFPGRFSFELLDNEHEYVYLAEKLSTYSGKALHSKKNHCNNFEKAYPGWEFVPITHKNAYECREMLKDWYNENIERVGYDILKEEKAFIRAFDNYDVLKLEGGMLVHKDKVFGFAIGEMSTDTCFDCHFEKAEINTNGAYPMVCREMTKLAMKNHPELIYINREEDMGIESLRKSKESYKPEFLIKKYLAKWNY